MTCDSCILIFELLTNCPHIQTIIIARAIHKTSFILLWKAASGLLKLWTICVKSEISGYGSAITDKEQRALSKSREICGHYSSCQYTRTWTKIGRVKILEDLNTRDEIFYFGHIWLIQKPVTDNKMVCFNANQRQR